MPLHKLISHQRLLASSLALGALTLVPSLASAHITLMSPAPRTADQKVGPCGAEGSVRGDEPLVFRPGETITVEWDETVDHVGHYRVAFDMDGQDDFPDPQYPEDDFPTTLVGQIPDRNGGGLYSQEITFPDQECDNCTLQLIQVMTVQQPYNSFYYQCSDIILRYEDGEAPDAGVSGADAGSSTPADGPTTGGCSSSQGQNSSWLLLAVAALFLRRKKS